MLLSRLLPCKLVWRDSLSDTSSDGDKDVNEWMIDVGRQRHDDTTYDAGLSALS